MPDIDFDGDFAVYNSFYNERGVSRDRRDEGDRHYEPENTRALYRQIFCGRLCRRYGRAGAQHSVWQINAWQPVAKYDDGNKWKYCMERCVRGSSRCGRRVVQLFVHAQDQADLADGCDPQRGKRGAVCAQEHPSAAPVASAGSHVFGVK